MRFKRLVARRGASAAPTAAIAQPDTSPAEPAALTALESKGEAFGEVTGAAEAADEERKGPRVVDAEDASVYRKEEVDDDDRVEEAAVDTKVAEDGRVEETGMEAEEVDEEDPVEVELVDDEASDEEQGANAADEVNEPDGYPEEVENEDGDVDHLNGEGDIGASVIDDAENAEVDRSISIVDLASSDWKSKELEIFIGGLPKDCVEDDIRKVFSEFGEIESVNIVKNPKTNRIKGFAFVRYANIEDAVKILDKFNDGTEVHSKLKELGIDEVEMNLPGDPDSGGRNKGFAVVQFASHSDAIGAFQRLRKPDAIFGVNRSAKVSFAQTPLRPSQDLLMKVKTVYFEHVPLSWDEEQIEECCKEHGEIKKIIIFRKLKRSKKKDICFVEFCSRDSALACVEGINNGRIGDGIVKVVASLARPVCKGRLAKQGTRGGYKVNSSTTVKGTDQPEHKKAPEDEVIVKKNALHKSKYVYRGSTEVRKASQHYKGKRQARGTKCTFLNQRPAKKARKECDVPVKCSKSMYVGGFGSPTDAYRVQPPTGPQYASIYQDFSHACASGSNAHSNDLEPHAGYIPATNHARSAYDQRIAAYHSPQTIVSYYDRGPLRPAYAAHANYTLFQSAYAYSPPSVPNPDDSLHYHSTI